MSIRNLSEAGKYKKTGKKRKMPWKLKAQLHPKLFSFESSKKNSIWKINFPLKDFNFFKFFHHFTKEKPAKNATKNARKTIKPSVRSRKRPTLTLPLPTPFYTQPLRKSVFSNEESYTA